MRFAFQRKAKCSLFACATAFLFSRKERLRFLKPPLVVRAVLVAAFPERLVQLLEQLALVLGELDGRFHRHVAVQVAGVAGAHAFDAFAAQAEGLAALGAFGQVDGGLALQRGHVDLAAQGGDGHAHRHLAVQVVAFALEDVVLAQADLDVEVARGAAVLARFAVAGAADALAIVDAGGDLDLQRLLLLDLALAVAGGAGLGGDLAAAGGVSTAIAVSVASGIAPATPTSGETFDRDAGVLIAGATPGDLNGEARVLTTSLTSITWATTAADGVATGTITIKYAPQTDWVKVYAGTNKAAYRSNHVQSRGRYLRIDDTGTTTARVRGYESMTDVDTGTGPFPTDAQMSGGGHWHKSVFANATAVKYRIFCDERFVLIEIAAGYSGGVNNIGAVARGFGDPIELSPSGDAWATLLSFNGVNATFVGRASFADASDSSADGQTVFPRALVGLGGSVQGVTAPFTGSGVSGGVATLGVAPSAVDGQIKTSRVFVRETGANLPPRAAVPGTRTPTPWPISPTQPPFRRCPVPSRAKRRSATPLSRQHPHPGACCVTFATSSQPPARSPTRWWSRRAPSRCRSSTAVCCCCAWPTATKPGKAGLTLRAITPPRAWSWA